MTLPRLQVIDWDRIGDDLRDWFSDHGTQVVGTIVLVLIATMIVRRVVPHAMRPAVTRQMAGRPDAEVERRVQTLSAVIVRTAEIVLGVFAFLTILPEFGFDIRAVLAGVSITSIAIGFGAQSLVRDALTGIFILAENQYGVGDTVTIANVTGAVEDISLRRTVVRDVDGVVHTVPNGIITTTANWTRDYPRVRVMIPLPPSTDLQKVREVADRVGEAMAKEPEWASIIITPPKYLRVDSIDMMGGVAVNVNGTVVPGKQWDVAGALRARLLDAFQEEGIVRRA